MNRTVIVTPSRICDNADVELAHKQMQRHLTCRVDHCLWKAAAHRTLVDAGRLAPQTSSPRERAAARGIAFPPLDNQSRTQRADDTDDPASVEQAFGAGITRPEREHSRRQKQSITFEGLVWARAAQKWMAGSHTGYSITTVFE